MDKSTWRKVFTEPRNHGWLREFDLFAKPTGAPEVDFSEDQSFDFSTISKRGQELKSDDWIGKYVWGLTPWSSQLEYFYGSAPNLETHGND